MTSRSETLEQLRAEVFSHFRGVAHDQRDVQTALPYLSFIRISRPTELNRGMLEPSMCLVLQGRKAMLIGTDITEYGAGSYVLSAIDMPVSGQVIRASRAEPYLGIRIALDPVEIAAVMMESGIVIPRSGGTRAGAYVEESDVELQGAFLRLVKLLDKPVDLPALSRLVKQEILYRLLTAADGDALGRAIISHAQEKGVTEAIGWIKANYAKPMTIESLARKVSMSVSNLHHRFKAITVMSPLQYQKQIRLLEARRLLLGGEQEAATVAFKVGYESASQFSREYRRLFGASPLQDVASLRQSELVP